MSSVQSNIVLDQVIFASIPRLTGSGYRIVAACPGVSTAEKTQITQKSPSHGGLCGGGDDAVGVSYYPLNSGRLCVSYSQTAGMEHTNRGGQCIYTRAFILTPEDMECLAYNPFNVLRSVAHAGLLAADMSPDSRLDPVEISMVDSGDEDRLTQAVRQFGDDWLRYVLQHLIHDRMVILVGDYPQADVVEAMLTAVPGPCRMALSFSAGLTHSFSRHFDICLVDEATARMRQTLRAHKATLIEPATADGPPELAEHAWCELAQRRWRQRQWQRLAALTNREYEDTSASALARYGMLCNELDDITKHDVATLLARMVQRLKDGAYDELSAELLGAYGNAAIEHLRIKTPSMDDETLTDCRRGISSLWRLGPDKLALTAPLVKAIISRAMQTSQIDALTHAVEWMTASGGPFDARPMHRIFTDLLNATEKWMAGADAHDIRQAAAVIQKWPSTDLLATRANQIHAILTDQLTTAV